MSNSQVAVNTFSEGFNCSQSVLSSLCDQFGLQKEMAYKSAHGSINCTKLLGFDLSKQSELEKARNSGLFKSLCPLLVKSAVEITEKLLEN